MMGLKLSKAGVYGDYDKVLNTPVDKVFLYFHYENYLNDYEEAFIEVNRNDG